MRPLRTQRLLRTKRLMPRPSNGRMFGPLVLLLIVSATICPLKAEPFKSQWETASQRTWVGEHYWANRLQDWRLHEGRLECVTTQPAMRTVHLLSRRVGPQPGSVRMRVRTGLLPAPKANAAPNANTARSADTAPRTNAESQAQTTQDLKAAPNAATGFLIGAGAADLDYRAAALIQQSPGPDGGYFAGIDGNGRLFIRDNSASGGLSGGRFQPPGIISRQDWNVIFADSQESDTPATNAIDGDPDTLWHTQWREQKRPHPHEIQIDLGAAQRVDALLYLPRQDQSNGRVDRFTLYLSNEKDAWGEPVVEGAWPNSDALQQVDFTAREARYLRLVCHGTFTGRPPTVIAELALLAENRPRGPKGATPINAGRAARGKALSLADVVLQLDAIPREDASYALKLNALDPDTGAVLDSVSLESVSADALVGNLALVSDPGKGRRAQAARFWYRDWTVDGPKVEVHDDRTAGPILSAQHTLSRGVLKMTAQMMPLGETDNQTVELQVQRDGQWQTVQETRIAPSGYTAPFRVAPWDSTRDTPYRLVYRLKQKGADPRVTMFAGTVRKDPVARDVIVVAGFTGNHNNRHGFGRKGFPWNLEGLWFPHNDVVNHVETHDPDLLFFSGDQVYEGDSPTQAERSGGRASELDYLYKWYLWCWAFRDLARDRPCVTIPDDHDVFQGNVWGGGGRHTNLDTKGGYLMPASWVKMVDRTQASHLPDPYDPTPIEQGIGVYYTSLLYGEVDFAVIEDRKFKSGPKGLVPATSGRPDHVTDPDFDPKSADVEGAILLGPRQLKFLGEWAADWRGVQMKSSLSQTVFAGVATHHGPKLSYLIADYDCNGWPQSGRNRALAELRRGFAFMIGGDQHLATIVHHGIDHFGDAGWSFAVPSIANFYPRAWRPLKPGKPLRPGMPDYTGQSLDGLGNHVSVWAATNPGRDMGHAPRELHDKMPGYGIVRFNKKQRTITMECWPRFADPADPKAQQYEGWPLTITQLSNDGRQPAGHLATLKTRNLDNPVVQVVEEATGEIVYTLRIRGREFRPMVYAPGRYTVHVGDPDRGVMRTLRNMRVPAEDEQSEIQLDF